VFTKFLLLFAYKLHLNFLQ